MGDDIPPNDMMDTPVGELGSGKAAHCYDEVMRAGLVKVESEGAQLAPKMQCQKISTLLRNRQQGFRDPTLAESKPI